MDILSILQWLVPSGALGGVVVWLTNRTIRQTRTIKEAHDTYKVMYNDVTETLIKVQDEQKQTNIELNKAIQQLNRTLQRAMRCRYYHQCPIRDELQKPEGFDPHKPKRQPSAKKGVRTDYAGGAA